MAKPRKPRKPPRKQSPAGSAKPADARPHDRSTGIVLLTMLAVCVATAVGVAFLTPLITAAPVVYYLVTSPDTRKRGPALVLIRRWAVTLLIMTIASAGFVTERTFASVPWGADAPRVIDAWMAGGSPPLGLGAIALAVLGFAVTAAASRGYAAMVIVAAGIGINAVYATYLLSKGYNLVLMALLAISPWQWCTLAGLVVLFHPLRLLSRHRFGGGGSVFDWNEQRRDVIVGAGLLVAALLLRLALSGAYQSLVRAWTIY